MSIHKISGDSRLTDIVMHLEYVLRTADEGSVGNYGEEAQDAWAKTALRRMISRVKAKKVKAITGQSTRDLWLKDVDTTLLEVCRSYKQEAGLKNLRHCLIAVEETALNHADASGRGYLDFLIGFFANEAMQNAVKRLEKP